MIEPLNKLKKLLFPELSEADQREKGLVSRYHLQRDRQVRHRYWLDDSHFISFDREDPLSVDAAEKAIVEYFRNPRIETAPRELRKQRIQGRPQPYDNTVLPAIDQLMTKDINPEPDYSSIFQGIPGEPRLNKK